MSNVVDFTGVTTLNLDPERLLENLKTQNLKGFVLAGYTKDGQEYFCTTYSNAAEILWLIERFKRDLLNSIDEE